MKNLLILALLLGSTFASATTYYIDFVGGADANNGTAKVTAWKHHPYMFGATGVSAAYVHAAGDQFIFKGGVTWPSASLPLRILFGGDATHQDYYGVDLTWFTGGSFSRPIFDGEYVNLAGNFVAGGCANQSNLICTFGVGYITFDNIEGKRLLSDSNIFRGIVMLIESGVNVGVVLTNMYMHDWRLISTFRSPDADCSTGAGTCRCDEKHGGFISNGVDATIQNSEIHNLDNMLYTGVWDCEQCSNGYDVHGGGGSVINFSNDTFHDSSNGILATSVSADKVTIYDSGFDSTGTRVLTFDTATPHCTTAFKLHDNVWFSNDGGTFSNLLFYNSTSGSRMMFPNICHSKFASTTWTLVNSVLIGDGVQLDPTNCNGTTVTGNVNIYNSTIQRSTSPILITNRTSTQPVSTMVIKDTHLITTNSSQKPACYIVTGNTSGPCGSANGFVNAATYTDFGAYSSGGLVAGAEKNLWQTNTDAQSDGYTNANPLVSGNNYAPTVITGKGVAAGFSLSSEYPNASPDIRSIPRTPSWDIGAYQFAAVASSYPVTITGNGNANGTICSDGVTCTDGIINAISTAGVISGTSSHTFTAGATVTLTGTATTGTFISFSGGGCTTSPCTITVNSPLTITATFQSSVTCTLTLAANSINAPATVSGTTSLAGLSGPTSFWFVLDPLNTTISVCSYPYSGCTAAGQSGNLPYTVSGLYSLGACSNGVCCTGSTAPLNINTGAGSAAH